MRVTLSAMVAVAVLAGLTLGVGRAAQNTQGAKPKASVKEVMAGAHKSQLHQKVIDGKASQEEKLELLDHYLSLAENKPTMGTQESWTTKTNALVVAAARAAVGRDDGSQLLKAASNCAACHKEHRPPAP